MALQAKFPFPPLNEIHPIFFSSYGRFDKQKRECYQAIMVAEAWDRLAAGDITIVDLIYDKLETTKPEHSGGSWMCLLGYFRYIAINGFPERFLLKNQHLWVKGYYIPDYWAEIMFISGASIISALALLT